MPWIIADSVLQEASAFLGVDLPDEWSRQIVRRKDEAGRDYLYMFFRHWLCAKIKRERRGLFRKLPWSYGLGKKLPLPA